MRERPILFSGPMVRAILNGTKTQTRRVVKDINPTLLASNPEPHHIANALRCPYGLPGDRLWVRESHAPRADCEVSWRASMIDGINRTIKGDICYAADKNSRDWVSKWRPSIHMPRWASRITLEVTGVRVQRLQDISEADAVAEGIEQAQPGYWRIYGRDTDGADMDRGARASYQSLWQSINGPGSWEANPWVWAVSFKRLENGNG